VRGVARARGHDATFMAKPHAGKSGSGLHFHVSLLDRAGNPVFADSARLRHAVGGLLASMPQALALFAPFANGFRRLRGRAYAPVRPNWGFDDRNVALRVLGEGIDRRVEHRVAGADANPYLALAAILGGIHLGLTRQLDPGPPAVPGMAADGPALPAGWAAAIDCFAAGDLLTPALGARYQALYAACKRAELEAFEALPDPRDYAFYLDRV
jgi:glutamine synthetase